MNEREITQTFDSIAYKKGATIINMIYKLIGENNFNEIEIVDALDELKKEKSKKFDSDLISSFYERDLKYSDGSWSPINKLKNKDILILGSGIGIKNFKKEIFYFINKIKPIVISLNINDNIPHKFVDYFIA